MGLQEVFADFHGEVAVNWVIRPRDEVSRDSDCGVANKFGLGIKQKYDGK